MRVRPAADKLLVIEASCGQWIHPFDAGEGRQILPNRGSRGVRRPVCARGPSQLGGPGRLFLSADLFRIR